MTTRREFLITSAVASTALTGVANASAHHELDSQRWGVLTDLTLCIGCRKCEWACNKENELPNMPLPLFNDTTVFENQRRPTSTQYTVVNRYPTTESNETESYAKVQCMHCEHPACVSACIVGALRKDPRGPVTYDAHKCIGCRYCMVACPFQIPSYEYENVLTPQVRKCTLCFERTMTDEKRPACVDICPEEAIVFGHRKDLLKLAHQRIAKHPDRYINHIYGEHEVGGTSWIYLSDRPFTDVGLIDLPTKNPADITETIQHGVFRGFAAPVLLFGLLGTLMKIMRKDNDE
jgi:formate dehydrogenase iron-sulfur subunit